MRQAPSSPRFFAGEWRAVAALLQLSGLAGTYDLVLTAETAYSLESLESLLACIQACLARPHGVAFIATKSYYFGVGGGTGRLMALVEGEGREGGGLVADLVQTFDDGLSNRREVVKISYRRTGVTGHDGVTRQTKF